MAAISITANNVVPSGSALFLEGNTKSHEAFTAGQTAYWYSADGTYGLADANGTTETNVCAGLFVNSGGAGQPCKILTYDTNLAIGGSVTLGMVYILGATPGQLTEYPDKTTGWHVQPICMAIDGTHVCVSLFPTSSGAIA